ncbi:hypothetical protein TD95_001665 [Thielaviopsis punctulata]|uniref:Acyltransferase MbtK/IucB-like conserved domain-containing protein n=1 Tax=Thielaviopsis punctulata TaxID=72032 RepID=A0A0F4ZG90_9PEZI|nr:hypothetical protein TD95_001665 [Thielaviopsis punctulata]
MAPPAQQLSAVSLDVPVIALPHPYLSAYSLQKSGDLFSIVETTAPKTALPTPMTRPDIRLADFSVLASSDTPIGSNNSPWARARRSPLTTISWTDASAPSLAQAWLALYVLFSVRPAVEHFRLGLVGAGADALAAQLKAVAVAVAHPLRPGETAVVPEDVADGGSLVVLRSMFWQGAGSPFGSRPVWMPQESPAALQAAGLSLSSFPVTPLQHTMTVAPAGDPFNAQRYQQSWHPIRPAKPAPGAVIYSRFIPHLGENFSMVAIDYHNEEHLKLFHEWQNDPRVSQGWNETGTLDEHREYLRRIDEDPHQFSVLARFDETFFAYFEIYWGKEDRLGAYYDADDYDRGRHSLVGDVRFRGPHRVSAWWSSLMHFLFLDDVRTRFVVGEPKETNNTVVAYDFMHGFGLDKFVDLPHKRSAFVRCSRERFFQLCPLGDNEKVVGGMRIGLVPKL